MLLWIAFALMTGAAALALLWPLARRVPARAGLPSDVAIYKDQLAEVERDRERGLIAGPEADAARIEISRRLIAADVASAAAGPRSASPLRRRMAALAVVVAVPALALGVYGRYGSPELPDMPLEARLDAPVENASLDELVARVEAHLAQQPEDGRGWEVLAPIYLRAGRAADAQTAYANALRLLGSTAARESAFGEAATVAADNVVTADAKRAFERAVALDADDPKARYYLGVAKEQDGDKAGAVADWSAVLDGLPPASPVSAFLRREIARVRGAGQPGVKGPDAEAVAAASDMTPADRAKMIGGMVEGLAARLKDKGGSLAEWQQLVRAYTVLGQKDKALAAAADARKALSASPEAVKALDELEAGLGLNG